MTSLYDNRTDTVVLYSGAAVTSGVTITDGLVYAGTNPQRTFAYRVRVLPAGALSSFVATGHGLTATRVHHFCVPRCVHAAWRGRLL